MGKVSKTVAIALCVGFVILLIWAGVQESIDGERKCEQLGGIFYSGSFGADNCVFPPKDKL